jgi:heme exporter protein D
MAFASFSDFLQMGQHGVYVWSTYGATLVIIVANVVAVIQRRRRFFKDQQRLLRIVERAQ